MTKLPSADILPFKRRDDDQGKEWHVTNPISRLVDAAIAQGPERKYVSLKNADGIVFYECRWDDIRMCYHASGSGIEIWHTNFHTAGEMWSAAHSILMG